MLQYASGILQSAVVEAQKCFSAPLDHTRHTVEVPPQFRKQPGSTIPFDSMSRSEVGFPDSRLQVEGPCIDSDQHMEGLLTGGMLRPNSSTAQSTPPPPVQSSTSPWPGKGYSSSTLPSETSTAHDTTPTTNSSLSVVVVEQDGTKVSSHLNLPSVVEKECLNHSPHNMLEDTLTKRTSSAVLAKETQKIHDAGLAPRRLEGAGDMQRLQESEVRSSWQIGSVLEVFSASLESWHPALVMQIAMNNKGVEMLTVQFWLDIDDAKQKRLSRADSHIAPLGTNCEGQLPPGFQKRASMSRPGQCVLLDATNGLKYETAELAWAAHFQRWLECQAAAGTQTIRSVGAVVAAVQPLAKAELPTASKLDATAAQGLVTEYALSRDAFQASSGTSVGLDTRTAQPEPLSTPIGLVTEYEHDWVAVCQDVKAIEKDRLNDAAPPPKSAAPAQDCLDDAEPPLLSAALAQDSLDDVVPPPVSAVLAQDSLEEAVPAPQSAELAQDRLGDGVPPPLSAAPAQDRTDDAVPPPPSAALAQDSTTSEQDSLDDAADSPLPAALAQDSLDDAAAPPLLAALAQDNLDDAASPPLSAALAQTVNGISTSTCGLSSQEDIKVPAGLHTVP